MATQGFDLERFVNAQDPVYDQAIGELRDGKKDTHWMWYVFPQLAGLGSSPKSIAYGISSLDEAWEYLQHPVLGPRLRESIGYLLTHDTTMDEVFGHIDSKKLLSSLTLFEQASGDPLFSEAIQRLYNDERDPRTLGLLHEQRWASMIKLGATVEELAKETYEDIMGFKGKGGHKPPRADIDNMMKIKDLMEASFNFGADYDESKAKQWKEMAGLDEREISILRDFQHLVSKFSSVDRAFEQMVGALAQGATSTDIRPQRAFTGTEEQARKFLAGILRKYENQQTPMLLNTITRALDDVYRSSADSYKLWPWMVTQLKREWKNHLYDNSLWGQNSTFNPADPNRTIDPSHYVDIVTEGGPILAELRRSNRVPQGLDVNQMSFKEFEDWLMDWKRENRESEDQGEVVYEFPDGWTIQSLTTPEQLQYEGDEMGHCVGGYHSQVEDGRSIIYSLRDRKGQPHATIEVEGDAHPYLKLMFDKPIKELGEEEARELGQAMAKGQVRAHPIAKDDDDYEYHQRLRNEQRLDLKDKFFPDYAFQHVAAKKPTEKVDRDQLYRYVGGMAMPLNDSPDTFPVTQVQGQSNMTPKPEYQERVRKFFNHLKDANNVQFVRSEDWYSPYDHDEYDSLSGLLVNNAEELSNFNDVYQDRWEEFHGVGQDEYGFENQPTYLDYLDLQEVIASVAASLNHADMTDYWDTDWEQAALNTIRVAALAGYSKEQFDRGYDAAVREHEIDVDTWIDQTVYRDPEVGSDVQQRFIELAEEKGIDISSTGAEGNYFDPMLAQRDFSDLWWEAREDVVGELKTSFEGNAPEYFDYLYQLGQHIEWPKTPRDLPEPGKFPKPQELFELTGQQAMWQQSPVSNPDNAGQTLPGTFSNVIEGESEPWDDDGLFEWRRPWYYDITNDTVILGQQGTHHSELDHEFGDEFPWGENENESFALEQYGGPELARGALVPNRDGTYFIEVFYVPEHFERTDDQIKDRLLEKLRGEGFSINPQDPTTDIFADSFSQWQAKTSAWGEEEGQFKPGDRVYDRRTPYIWWTVVGEADGPAGAKLNGVDTFYILDSPTSPQANVNFVGPPHRDVKPGNLLRLVNQDEQMTLLAAWGEKPEYKEGDVIIFPDTEPGWFGIISGVYQVGFDEGPYFADILWMNLDLFRETNDHTVSSRRETNMPLEGAIVYDQPRQLREQHRMFYAAWGDAQPSLTHIQEIRIKQTLNMPGVEDVDIIEGYADGSVAAIVMMELDGDNLDNTDTNDYIINITPEGEVTYGLSSRTPTRNPDNFQMKIGAWGDEPQEQSGMLFRAPDDDLIWTLDGWQLVDAHRKGSEGSEVYDIISPWGSEEGQIDMDVNFSYRTEQPENADVYALTTRDPGADEFLAAFFDEVRGEWDRSKIWEWDMYDYGTADWRETDNVSDGDDLMRMLDEMGGYSYDNWSYEWDDSDLDYEQNNQDEHNIWLWEATIKEPMPYAIGFDPSDWMEIFNEELQEIAKYGQNEDSQALAQALIKVPEFIWEEDSQQWDINGRGDLGTPSREAWKGVGDMNFIHSAVAEAMSQYEHMPEVIGWLKDIAQLPQEQIPGQGQLFDNTGTDWRSLTFPNTFSKKAAWDDKPAEPSPAAWGQFEMAPEMEYEDGEEFYITHPEEMMQWYESYIADPDQFNPESVTQYEQQGTYYNPNVLMMVERGPSWLTVDFEDLVINMVNEMHEADADSRGYRSRGEPDQWMDALVALYKLQEQLDPQKLQGVEWEKLKEYTNEKIHENFMELTEYNFEWLSDGIFEWWKSYVWEGSEKAEAFEAEDRDDYDIYDEFNEWRDNNEEEYYKEYGEMEKYLFDEHMPNQRWWLKEWGIDWWKPEVAATATTASMRLQPGAVVSLVSDPNQLFTLIEPSEGAEPGWWRVQREDGSMAQMNESAMEKRKPGQLTLAGYKFNPDNPSPSYWPPEKIQALIDRYIEGANLLTLAQEFGISHEWARQLLRKHEVEIAPRGRPRRMAKADE